MLGDGIRGVQERFRWRWGKQGNRSECQTLCDPVGYNLPGSSIHGILQVRVLEWVAISFSRESSRPKDRTRVSCIAGRHFTIWDTREARWILDIQISPAHCRTKRGKEDLGQGSASFVIGLLFNKRRSSISSSCPSLWFQWKFHWKSALKQFGAYICFCNMAKKWY